MLDSSAPESQVAILEDAIDISRRLSYLLWIIIACSSIAYTIWTRVSQRSGQLVQLTAFGCRKWLSRAVVGKRHAETIKLCNLTIGTMPTGAQSTLLFTYTIFIVLACTLGYRTTSTNDVPMALQLCKYVALRTGIIALANLPLVVGLAGRNNILAMITGISKDTLNTLHRWSGRMVLVLSLAHTACYLVSYGLRTGEDTYLSILQAAYSNAYFKAGIAALVGVIFLTTHSLRFLRERCYNLFRILHIFGVLAFLIGTLLHALYAETGGKVTFWLYISLGLFFLDHFARLVQIVYANCPIPFADSIRATTLCLTPINSEITKVVVSLPRCPFVNEGETIYLLIPSLSLYQWHPFTVISTTDEEYRRVRQLSCDTIASTTSTLYNEDCGGDDDEKCDLEKTVAAVDCERASPVPSAHHLQLRIKARGPFSKAVHQLAVSRPEPMSVRAFVQPVVQRSFLDVKVYDTMVLVAGGIGITAILPVLKRAVTSRSEANITFIWCVKSFAEYVNLADELESLVMRHRYDGQTRARLSVAIYVTAETRPWPLTLSCPVPVLYKKPDLDTVLAESTTTTTTTTTSCSSQRKGGRTGIAACGPPRLVDGIRSWITGPQCDIPVDYHDHSF